MTEPAAGQVTSADGTTIAFDRSGAGPAVVLVHGAFTDRTHPALAAVAAAMSPWFTVVNYDRRGRGGSGDTPPYAVEREVEDLAAVLAAAGGPGMVFGGSSGCGLVVRAAAQDPALGPARAPAITRVALWEPPYHVDDTAPELPADFGARLDGLVRAGRRGDAVELFMTRAAEMPAEAVAAMRRDSSWPATEAVAHTLAYEAAVMGQGNALPGRLLAGIAQPALVLNGGQSPGWMRAAGLAVAAAIPGAAHRVLPGQSHNPAPEALAPELLEFFAS